MLRLGSLGSCLESFQRLPAATSDLEPAPSEPGMKLWESGVRDKSKEDESEEPERSIGRQRILF